VDIPKDQPQMITALISIIVLVRHRQIKTSLQASPSQRSSTSKVVGFGVVRSSRSCVPSSTSPSRSLATRANTWSRLRSTERRFPVVFGYAEATPAREGDSMERPLDSTRAANVVKYDSASTAPADSSARFAKSADSPDVMGRLKMPNARA